MGLFKKKEKIPTIPTAPSLPALPALPALEPIASQPSKRNLPELPSFPASAQNEDINQEIVKSAVSDATPQENEEPQRGIPASIKTGGTALPQEPSQETLIPKLPKLTDPIDPQGVESKKLEAPIIPSAQKTPIASTALVRSPSPKTQPEKHNDPIFVRIDKFQVAQKNFDEIKSKVEEIESILQKMIDVKSQEDEELKGWTKDTEKLKSRLAEIDADLFSQL